MKPGLLDEKLQKDKEKYSKNYGIIQLMYGDCSINMDKIANGKSVVRPKGINCIEILLGTKKYKELRNEGAFFLLPEWTKRWKEVFQFELKLEADVAKEFMQDFHTKLIYVDTCSMEIPNFELNEIKEYTGLDVEILKLNKKDLQQRLKTIIERRD
jgi:hypothetical protein